VLSAQCSVLSPRGVELRGSACVSRKNVGMNGIKRFEDIRAWQKARVLTATIYRESEVGKFSRDFALRNQIRDAAISTQSNIARLMSDTSPRRRCIL
jgi:hypothetical protein